MKDTKVKKSCSNLIIYLILHFTYIFFSTVNIYLNFILLILVFLFNIFILSKTGKIKNDVISLLWIFFELICIISLFSPYNQDIKNGITFIICSISFLLTYLVLTGEKSNWLEKFIKIFYFFSAIFAFATLLQIFLPSTIDSIKNIYIQDDKVALSRSFIEKESLYSGYNGLVVQTGTNAFLICIFIGLTLFNLLRNPEKKLKNIILIALGFILLILTNKRTLLLAGIFAFILVFLLYKKFNFKYIVTIILLSFIFAFFIFNYTNIGNRIVQKFGMDQEHSLSGREILYEKMYINFRKSPIIGVGIDSKVNGQDGHNIYLQVASETGIFGILIILIFLCRNLFITYQYLMKEEKYKPHFAFSLYMQLIFIIWGLTGNPLYDQFVLLTYFLVMAITTYCINKINLEEL